MKVLVTGGAGYIGSVTAEALLRARHEVIVVDNLCEGHREAVPPQAVFVQQDLADAARVREIFERQRPEAVIHFAGYIQVGESTRNPFKYLGENIAMGISVLKAAVETKTKRFILSSTANLFGNPERVPIDESTTLSPGSPYGESKLYLERVLHWLDQTQGFRSAALRYFNAAGATEERGEDHHPETHLIPLALEVASGQRPSISIFGNDYDTPDGTCIRDYVHVTDLAQAHILALEAPGRGFSTYNVGNGDGFSVQQVLEAARRVTGHAIPAVVAPRRMGDPARLVADSGRIRRELGWKPEFPELQRIVETAWRWRQRHPKGYAKA